MNLLQMDMNLLKVLYVLLETSFTGKTAQKLALSPSAVSHALMRLRDALNDPLFRREGNRQIATPYAQALRDKLAPVFVSLNEELFGDKENGSRCFRVVLPPALNALLTPVLAEKGHLHQAVIECLPFARRPGVMNCWIARLIWCWQLATIKSRSALCITSGWGRRV